MSFILKSDPTVIHIKLTNKGRQLLSTGQLTFSKFSLGDSEIDYAFNDAISFNTFEQKILRPKDQNPNIVNFIEQTVGGETMVDLPTVVSNTSVITNTATERGFFSVDSGGTFTMKNSLTYVKNPYGIIEIVNATGGTGITINKSATATATEPEVGDYMLVKWANPYLLTGTTGNTVNENVPYIWYKIENIISGTLAGDDLFVGVDKPLPNFNGNGSGIYSLAYFFPNSNNREISGDSMQNYYGYKYIGDFLETATLTFMQNWDCGVGSMSGQTCESGVDVPVWNMSIIYTDDVAGVQSTDYNYDQYYTKEMGGFVRYIQQITPWIKKIGVIHYTNQMPYNTYGEGLYDTTPTLNLPTIMWHKQSGSTIGLTLSASTIEYQITGLTSVYRDLVDQYGNIVGKVFNDLQLFVIEDQELLFAMSYKANRSWTLPEFTAALNVSLCPVSDIEVEIV